MINQSWDITLLRSPWSAILDGWTPIKFERIGDRSNFEALFWASWGWWNRFADWVWFAVGSGKFRGKGAPMGAPCAPMGAGATAPSGGQNGAVTKFPTQDTLKLHPIRLHYIIYILFGCFLLPPHDVFNRLYGTPPPQIYRWGSVATELTKNMI